MDNLEIIDCDNNYNYIVICKNSKPLYLFEQELVEYIGQGKKVLLDRLFLSKNGVNRYIEMSIINNKPIYSTPLNINSNIINLIDDYFKKNIILIQSNLCLNKNFKEKLIKEYSI